MPQGDVETFHKDDAWHNRVEGANDVRGRYGTKDEAVAEGRAWARDLGVEHIIRNLDGRIGERDSHGHDPRDIKG